ncbi:MAG: SidA/IucD/PvdA family monooxygenase [Spirochaetota bacterium]
MNNNIPHYDLVGVGVGPFNLSLAALLEPHRAGGENLKALFLERKQKFEWHPGVILPGTTLQVPFLADLTSLVDPTSPYTFLNYLHHQGRLYKFYFYENFKVFRKEYSHYCRWVAEQLETVEFSKEVKKIEAVGDEFLVTYLDTSRGEHETVRASNLVLGYGTQPYVPEVAREFLGDNVFHTSAFRPFKHRFLQAKDITIVGSGQSAAECFQHVLNERGHEKYRMNWFTRGEGFLPMEYSKLGLEHFSPEYINYFYDLPEKVRDRIRSGQDLWYKGISGDTIGEIFDILYELDLEEEKPDIGLTARVELRGVKRLGTNELELTLFHRDEEIELRHKTDILLLGTGYYQGQPKFLENLSTLLETDSSNRFQVSRDYKLLRKDKQGGTIYVQNGEIHSHGIGAPDLGLGAYRSASIINSLLGKDIYKLFQKNVFQSFGTEALRKMSYQEVR